MADELERPGETPEHEDAEAHLPAPTIWPFAFAGAVALILLGLIVNMWATVIGVVLAVITLACIAVFTALSGGITNAVQNVVDILP